MKVREICRVPMLKTFSAETIKYILTIFLVFNKWLPFFYYTVYT